MPTDMPQPHGDPYGEATQAPGAPGPVLAGEDCGRSELPAYHQSRQAVLCLLTEDEGCVGETKVMEILQLPVRCGGC